jgi:alkanesulfonate monooxygenase SsuD/methylene tetrahydromethanopterin reductase-like flavin-dependent oxidoreductase (luciferase family)
MARYLSIYLRKRQLIFCSELGDADKGDAMKLGIGLPNTMPVETDRALMLAWAKLADQAGFHTLATIDKPAYDSWDPLVTLAGVAGVTEKARLATTILQLPNRNETLVAKQAAVIDRLSGGRLDLGVAQGGRADDYEVFRASPKGRSQRLEEQVGRIRELWEAARSSDRDHGVTGPAPLQDPCPIWVGASREKAMERAVRIGDGFIFGTSGAARMGKLTPWLREQAAAQGKPDLPIAGLAYVGVGNDAEAALEEATHHAVRYYGELWTEPRELIHHGPAEKIAEEVAAYASSRIDLLILFPQIPRLGQVEELARAVLPVYL